MRAVQFHPKFCKEAEGTDPTEWDSTHDLSLILDNGERVRIGSFGSANTALHAGKAVEAVINGPNDQEMEEVNALIMELRTLMPTDYPGNRRVCSAMEAAAIRLNHYKIAVKLLELMSQNYREWIVHLQQKLEETDA